MVAWKGAKIHVLTHGLHMQTPSSKASALIEFIRRRKSATEVSRFR